MSAFKTAHKNFSKVFVFEQKYLRNEGLQRSAENRSPVNQYIIPNLKNACQVLVLLSTEKEPLTVSDLAKRLSVPRTSMVRIMSTLEAEGMVEKRQKGYRAGALLFRSGLMALRQSNLRVLGREVLGRLSAATGETAHLAQRVGHQMLILEVSESPNTVRAASQAGRLVDIHCSATGKVMLAHAVDDVPGLLAGHKLEARTENTITDLDTLMKALEQVREQGYALDDVEYVAGVRCCAAPVYDPVGDVVAAIGITASITTFTRDRVEFIVNQVRAAAHEFIAGAS